MKKLFILIFLISCSVAYAQQIQFNVIPGALKYSDEKRFAGDTVFLKIDLQPSKSYFIAFQNKVSKGVQGYLYDSYLMLTYPVNPNEGYHEFNTNEEPLSFSPNRFYLRLLKCF